MRLILVLSLLLNGALGIHFFRRAPTAPVQIQSLPSHNPSAPAPKDALPRTTNAPAVTPESKPAPAFSWHGIESSDYRQYIANLRAIGCPEDVIRDLITADVQKLYNRRAKAIRGETKPHEYWQKYSNQRPPPEQMKQYEAIEKEKNELLKSILGITSSSQSLIDAVYLQTDPRIAELGWLPEEKRAAARRAFEAANLREKEFAADNDRGDHRVLEKKLLDARIALLKEVLTPAELEEYRLRSSPTAASLVTETKYLDLSYADFQKILKVSDDLGQEKGNPFNRSEERMKALRAVLGDARAEEFERKTDFNYDGARDAIARLNLPEDTADRVWQIKRDTIAAARLVQDNAALSNAEKEQRYQTMRDSTRATLMQLLGPDGFELTQKRNRIWLDLLGKLKQ